MRWYFEYVQRLLSTALSFAVFGLGGLLVGILVFPPMFLFVRDRTRRRVAARALIGRMFGAFVWFMSVQRLFDYRIEGRENIDDQRRQLIIANHPTLIDVVILISLFPQANCVIKEAVTRNPFMRGVVRAADYISNSEPAELVNSCTDYLSRGKTLLLFPEGTRTRHNEPLVFRPGAATVAARTGADVLPVAISCEPRILSKQQPWYHVSRPRPMITVRILPPRPASEVLPGDDNPRHYRYELNDALLGIIRTELNDMAFSRQAI